MHQKLQNCYLVKTTQHLLEHNLYKVFAVLWTLVIFYLCLDDSPNLPKFTFPYKDKVVHFIFYFVFVFFWIKSLKIKSNDYLVVVLFVALLQGIGIEFLQENFTIHRTFDWYDILANSIGAIVSLITIKKFYAIKSN